MTSQPATGNVASPTLVLLLIGGGLVFAFGRAVAVATRARSDYHRTKAALRGLRKDRWGTLWIAVKIGFWVVVAVVVLTAWAVREILQRAGAG